MIEFMQQFGCPRGEEGAVVARFMAASHVADYEAVLSRIELRPGLRLLEIGMGNGSHVPSLVARGIDYCGIDISPDMVRQASELCPDARFICADVCDGALPSCDAAIAVNSLQWWLDPAAAFKALNEVLGGALVMGIASPPPVGLLPQAGQRHYAPSEICGMMKAAGFSGVDCQSEMVGGRYYLIARGNA